MNEPPRHSLWKLLGIAFVLCVIVFDVHADPEVLQSNDMNNSANSGSLEVITKSYGLSGSDMDIGQCMYHAGALTVAIGFRNKFCEGMDMIRVGLIDAGVLHICKQTKIGKNYDSLEDCQDGLSVVYVDLPPDEPETVDRDDEQYDALYARIMDLELQRSKDADNIKKAAQRANAAVLIANKAEDEKMRQLIKDLKQ